MTPLPKNSHLVHLVPKKRPFQQERLVFFLIPSLRGEVTYFTGGTYFLMKQADPTSPDVFLLVPSCVPSNKAQLSCDFTAFQSLFLHIDGCLGTTECKDSKPNLKPISWSNCKNRKVAPYLFGPCAFGVIPLLKYQSWNCTILTLNLIVLMPPIAKTSSLRINCKILTTEELCEASGNLECFRL